MKTSATDPASSTAMSTDAAAMHRVPWRRAALQAFEADDPACALIRALYRHANRAGAATAGKRTLYQDASLTRRDGDAARTRLISRGWLVQLDSGGPRTGSQPSTPSTYLLTNPRVGRHQRGDRRDG